MGRLKSNIIYSGILTTSVYVFPLLVFPYVSRVLGPGNIGLVGFIDGIINYFILLSIMGVGVIGIREVAATRTDRPRLDSAFSSMLALSGISTLVAIVALVVATALVTELRENSTMMAIGAVKLVSNFFLIEWFYKGLEDFRFITVRSIAVKCLYVASVFIFVKTADDYVIYFLLTALMITFNALINMIYARRFTSFRLKSVRLAPYFKSFMIYGFYMILTSMYTTFNIVYLGFSCGDLEAGYYTTATKLFNIIVAIFAAVSGVMMPRLSSLLAEGKTDEFRSLLGKSWDMIVALTIPAIVFVIILAPEIVLLVSGKGFEGAVLPMRITIPLIFVIGYEQILVIQTLMPLKRDAVVMRNSAIGAVVGVTLNLLIVHRFQAVGSSVTWVISELVIMILSQIAVTRALGSRPRLTELAVNLLMYVPLGVCLWLLTRVIADPYMRLIAGGVFALGYFLALQLGILRKGFCATSLRRIFKR